MAVFFLPPFVFFSPAAAPESPVAAPPSLLTSLSAFSLSACPLMNSSRDGVHRQPRDSLISSTDTVVHLACLKKIIRPQNALKLRSLTVDLYYWTVQS